jgi:AcrR family transcriptional regulator
MKNKEIQEERIRSYFIEATKELLKGEGLKVVNVRNIADRAGYSFATLYNYFKDVKDLIFECVKDFQDECAEYVSSETKSTPAGAEKIKAITKAYVKYFIQYPGIFELFFIEKTRDIANKQPTIELIYTFLDRLCAEEWQYCIENNIIDTEKSDIMKNQLRYLITGLLFLYINRRHPSEYMEFNRLVNEQLDYMFAE